MKKCQKLIESCDLFGVPLELRISQETRYKSMIGCIFSVVIYCLCVCYGIVQITRYARNEFLPFVSDQTQAIHEDIDLNLGYSPFKGEIGLASQDHDLQKSLFWEEKNRVLSVLMTQATSNLQPIGKVFQAIECAPTIGQSGAFCLPKEQARLRHDQDSSTSIIILMSPCSNISDSKCMETNESQQTMQKLKVNRELMLQVTITLQEFDMVTQRIVEYPQSNSFDLNTNKQLFQQIKLQITEVQLTQGFIFQTTRSFYMITGVNIQSSYLERKNGEQYYLGCIFFDNLQNVRIIQYREFTYVMAQIASIFQTLFLIRYIILFINQKRLQHELVIEILKIFFPDLRKKKIQYDFLGYIKAVEGMQTQEVQTFMKQYEQMALNKLSILNILNQLTQVQWAIFNIIPLDYCKLLKRQGIKFVKQKVDDSKLDNLILENEDEDSNILNVFENIDNVTLKSLISDSQIELQLKDKSQIPLVLNTQAFYRNLHENSVDS